MERAAGGSGVIIVWVVAAAAITRDDQDIQFPCPSRECQALGGMANCLALSALDSDGYQLGSFHHLPSSLWSWTGNTARAQ